MSIIKSKEYKEEQARRTLHYICDFSLENWEHLDGPDLQNSIDSYGIEVVQDLPKNEQKMTRFVETVWDKLYSEIDEQKVGEFERLGGSFMIENEKIHVASLGERPNAPEHLIGTIKKKIDLLNTGGYRHFEQYDLYVFVGTTLVDENFPSHVQQVIEQVSSYQDSKKLKYGTLYLDQLYVMCICDLKKKSFEWKEISKEIRDRVHQETKELWSN